LGENAQLFNRFGFESEYAACTLQNYWQSLLGLDRGNDGARRPGTSPEELKTTASETEAAPVRFISDSNPIPNQ
jgi:hypothetical protein